MNRRSPPRSRRREYSTMCETCRSFPDPARAPGSRWWEEAALGQIARRFFDVRPLMISDPVIDGIFCVLKHDPAPLWPTHDSIIWLTPPEPGSGSTPSSRLYIVRRTPAVSGSLRTFQIWPDLPGAVRLVRESVPSIVEASSGTSATCASGFWLAVSPIIKGTAGSSARDGTQRSPTKRNPIRISSSTLPELISPQSPGPVRGHSK